MQQVDATKPGAVAVTSDGVLMANDGSDYDSKADYFLELTSNIFFLVASILYVWLSAIDVGYAVEYHEALRNGELQYYMLYWNQMPPQAHGAASVLGYDKKTWDSGGYVEEVDLWWDCLPEKMVKAAEVLGYTQSKWDGGPAPVPLVCDTLASNATSAVDFNSTDVNANLTADGSPLWTDLSPEERQAASVLGYDQTMWNAGETPPEIAIWYECLSDDQNAAAAILGYDQAAWDGGYEAPPQLDCAVNAAATWAPTMEPVAAEEGSVPSPTPGLATTPDGSPLWAALSPEEQQAASVLGYDQTMWNAGETPPEIAIWYQCLSDNQNAAAAILGYDQAAWDGAYEAPPQLDCAVNAAATWAPTMEPTAVPVPVSLVPPMSAPPTVAPNAGTWAALSPVEQQAASVLGYDQTMWNTGETPPEIAIWYDCLKSDQIVAAAILGYDRAVWDGGYEPPPQLDCAVNPAATWAPTMEPVPVPAPAARYLEGEGEGFGEGEGEGVGAVTASPSTYEDDFGEEERYRLIYIFAAWFFVLTGLIEWWFMGEWYPLVFVAAGVFGFVSALYVLSNVFYSNIFNCASINCFFIEALFMIWYRFRGPKDYRISMIVADASFALGSIIELVLCYQYVFDEFAWISMTVVVFNTFAQCLWVVCALIYTVLTLRIYGPTMQELEAEKVKKEELAAQEKEVDVEESTSSDAEQAIAN
jgi:hypothetical protein